MPDENPPVGEVVRCNAEPLSPREKRIAELVGDMKRGNMLRLKSTVGLESIAESIGDRMGGPEGFADAFKRAMDKALEKGAGGHVASLLGRYIEMLDKIGQAGDRMLEQYTDEELQVRMAEAFIGAYKQNEELGRVLLEEEVTEGR